MALGERIWEGKGRSTGLTVKSVGVEGTSMEMNAVADLKGVGRLEGVGFRDMGTVAGLIRPDRTFVATGQGLLTAKEGDIVAYKAFGMYRIEAGAAKGPSLLTFSTASARLSWMNGFVAVSDIKIDLASYEYTTQGYAWR